MRELLEVILSYKIQEVLFGSMKRLEKDLEKGGAIFFPLMSLGKRKKTQDINTAKSMSALAYVFVLIQIAICINNYVCLGS